MNFGNQLVMPSSSENQELAIVGKLQALVDESSYARRLAVHDLLVDYCVEAHSDAVNPDGMQRYIEICQEISQAVDLRVEGHLSDQDLSGAIVIVNHIGANKLVKVYPDEIVRRSFERQEHEVKPLVNNDSFLMLFAPAVGAMISYWRYRKFFPISLAINYPEPYGSFARSLGFVLFNPSDTRQFENIRAKMTDLLGQARALNLPPVIFLFPEGGTSGKWSNQGPFCLEPFRTGFYFLARELKLPIQPIAVGFSPDFSFWAKILSPEVAGNTNSHISIKLIRERMQCELNRKFGIEKL